MRYAPKLAVPFSKTSILMVVIIAAIAIVLSIVSYQFSNQTASEINRIASNDIRSNAEIQARDLARILANKIDIVSSNLILMSDAPAIQSHDVESAIPLFASARSTTVDFASSYFWVDADGTLLWADAFTNSTIEQQYNGDDRSFRDYYSTPRDTFAPYYSTVIESVDGVPRLYVAYPILDRSTSVGQQSPSTPQQTDDPIFKGVVVSAVDLDDIGKFLQSELSPKHSSTVGLLARDGIILYTGNASFTGKDIFGAEFQSLLPSGIKDTFNGFIRESLTGQPGSGDISYLGNTSTIAFEPVSIRGNDFAILYVSAPHQLADNAGILIAQQRTFNSILIAVIGGIAAGIAFVILVWNRRLTATVDLRTSELKTANQDLTDANEQLLLNDKMQREFINIAAHELRTPTQAILGYADLFEMQPESREEAIKAVTRNALRLERLTQDILDVSRIEGRALELNKEKFNISEVILASLDDARRQVANGDIKFAYQGPDDIIVEADKARISQVVSNLLNNAVKFTKKGTIAINVVQMNGEATVIVSDTGSGIHPEMIPRLFTKFASKSQTGTGLGLFISKSIVEAHGGRISGENKGEGKGAAFSFTVPLSLTNEKYADRETIKS
jgi:signal transduction histidine kinase